MPLWAAYAFAKIDFKGRGVIFMIFLSTMMIPTEVTLIPRFMLFKELGLYNTRWAIILPNWFAPGAVFMLRQFYMGLPNDLMEAAKIDGAGHPRIFAQILLPLTKAALVSQCVLSFVSCWNEYMAPHGLPGEEESVHRGSGGPVDHDGRGCPYRT